MEENLLGNKAGITELVFDRNGVANCLFIRDTLVTKKIKELEAQGCKLLEDPEER
jgi:hypothetical protein